MWKAAFAAAMEAASAGPLSTGLAALKSSAENLTALMGTTVWDDLLAGPYNDSESLEWQQEYVRQYQRRHRNDPEVKYAVLIFYLIMVSPRL